MKCEEQAPNPRVLGKHAVDLEIEDETFFGG